MGRDVGDAFPEIRREMELAHCKWDTQVGDVTGLVSFPLLMDQKSWQELAAYAELLTAETIALEAALLERTDLHAQLALPSALRSLFRSTALQELTPAAARILRFDFHYTTDGWKVSEVNSDVPGGFTEATSFTRLMAREVCGTRMAGDPTAALMDALVRRIGDGAVLALTSAPGFMEDHQVNAYLAARARERGLRAVVVSVGQLTWERGRAHTTTNEARTGVDAIVRFYQAEWLARLSPRVPWRSLFAGGRTPVANPGVAALSESKRLPLLWNELGVPVPTWRALLPETRALHDAPWIRDAGWLIKSAYSNTGDTVSIRGEMTPLAWTRRAVAARLSATSWIAQRQFEVVPLVHQGASLVPCIGVYTVDGVAAGAYARIATKAVVDSHARDAALLISGDP